MIQQSIDQINEGLDYHLLSLAGEKQLLKTAKVVYDQNEAGNRLLVDGDEQTRLTLDDAFSWQSVHVVGRLQRNPSLSNMFGSITENRYDLAVMLLVAAKLPTLELIERITDAFNTVKNLRIDAIEAETINVLRNNWLQPMGQDKNYDPALSAIAVRYTILDAKMLTGELVTEE